MAITQNGVLKRDDNDVPVMGGTSSVDNATIINSAFDPVTRRLLTDSASGSGTVTSVSVVNANGFDGTVANATTTPAITIKTTVTGIVKGNGTAISAAVAGDVDSILPTQTGHAGEFLTTDGTNSSWATPAGSGGITIGTTTITSGTNTRILYDNAGVVGEYTITGTGTVVAMQTSPSFTTPSLGVATATTINKVAFTAPATGSTLTIADGKTLTASNTMTLQGGDASVLSIAAAKTLTQSNTLTYQGTDGSTVNFGAGGTVLYSASTIPLTVGSTTIASGTNTRILYDNSGVLGEYTLTGSGTVVAMQTAPTFATSITTPSVLATANDSGALGASGTAFADLFLASGGVINWSAGDYTLTHSAGILTANKDFRITSANVGTNADSVPTLSSTSTLTNKTLTSPVITTGSYSGAQTLQESASIALDPALSADGTWTGITRTGTAGATLAFGDLVYLNSTPKWVLADADAASTSGSVLLGICVLAAASDGDPTTVLLWGNVRADTAFPTMTVGAPQYVSATAGDITGTQPSSTDQVIRVVGFALGADELMFVPSSDYITHT